MAASLTTDLVARAPHEVPPSPFEDRDSVDNDRVSALLSAFKNEERDVVARMVHSIVYLHRVLGVPSQVLVHVFQGRYRFDIVPLLASAAMPPVLTEESLRMYEKALQGRSEHADAHIIHFDEARKGTLMACFEYFRLEMALMAQPECWVFLAVCRDIHTSCKRLEAGEGNAQASREKLAALIGEIAPVGEACKRSLDSFMAGVFDAELQPIMNEAILRAAPFTS